MRWLMNKPESIKLGEERNVTKFLLLPRLMRANKDSEELEWRWFEKATFHQTFVRSELYSFGVYTTTKEWINNYWVN